MSDSLVSENSRRLCSGITAFANVAESSAVSVSNDVGCSSPSIRTNGTFPTFRWRSLAPRSTVWRSSSSRSEEHTSEIQSRQYLVCRLLLEKKKKHLTYHHLLSQ